MAHNGTQVAEGGDTQTLKQSIDMENETNIPNEEQTGRLQQPAVIQSACPLCEGKGWYFVDEWIGPLQGRRDCVCGGQAVE